jgi:Tfp pilus assembly protein PilF
VAVALAAVAYLGALDNPFVYDDRDTVVANESLRSGSVHYILGYSLFRPVVNVSYAADYAVWGLRPFGFHLTNLALHLLVVALFYGVVWRLVDDRNAVGPRALPAWPAATAAAILWGVHPLLTEAVAYVSGRSELLSAAGTLAALLWWRSGMLSGRAGSLVLGTFAFLLAIAAKETAAAAPVVLLAWDRLLMPDRGRRWRMLRVHAPLLAFVAMAGIARLWVLLSAEAPLLRGPWENLLLQARVIPRYAMLTFAPLGQTIMHGVTFPNGPADLLSLVLLGAMAAGACLAWRLRGSEPLVPFGILWFLLLLLPSSSVIALREPMAEHRAYLASAGLVVLAVAATFRSARVGGSLGAGVVGAIGVALALLTMSRVDVWADPVRLWEEAARRAPEMWEPHYSLGDALREQNRCGEAVTAYRRVVALRPNHRDAQNNLGICLAQLGRRDEAREAFEASLRADPSFARGHTNLGNLALVEGDLARARRHFLDAIEADSANVTARRQLIAISEVRGEFADAVKYCHELAGVIGMVPELTACIARNEAKLRAAER